MKTKVFIFFITLSCAVSMAQDRYEEFADKKVTIPLPSGILTSYIDAGAKNGDAVILLHGYTDTGRSFQLLLEEMLKLNPGRRIIIPDLRGHGGSSMPMGADCATNPEKYFTANQMADDVVQLMDALHIETASVVGHSMGSTVAQALAVAYPQRMEKLVLIGTFVNGKSNPTIQNLLIADLLERRYRQAANSKLWKWPDDVYHTPVIELGTEIGEFLRAFWVTEAPADPALIEAIYAETMQIKLGTWIGAIKALSGFDSRKDVAAIQSPTLILWATQDPFFTADDQETVKKAFAVVGKKGVPVFYKTYGRQPLSAEDGAPATEIGHNTHWAAPLHVARDIESFLSNTYPTHIVPFCYERNVRQILEDNSRTSVQRLN